jgi:hypothetical protein
VLQQKALGTWQEALSKQQLEHTKADIFNARRLLNRHVKKWNFKLRSLRKRQRSRLLQVYHQKSRNKMLKNSFILWKGQSLKRQVMLAFAIKKAGKSERTLSRRYFRTWSDKFATHLNSFDTAVYRYRRVQLR